ncbi:hypothetical protein LIER_01311 [Lithospermum erythrorhizon]|uniref:Uncharacterized protein n=1 Tax=Lithospermum erythrorhizon TaxID=34254 RepID=A0AAV3NQ88_LITER
MGDFNDILNREEKTGGLETTERSMQMFCDFVRDCKVLDIGYVGYPFTWCNHREGGELIRIRLDRVLGNSSWCLQYPKVVCYHLDMAGADHCPVMMDTDAKIEKGK